MPFLRSDRPGGHLTQSIGIQTPKRLKKHQKMDGYSTPPERHVISITNLIAGID